MPDLLVGCRSFGSRSVSIFLFLIKAGPSEREGADSARARRQLATRFIICARLPYFRSAPPDNRTKNIKKRPTEINKYSIYIF